MKPTTLRMRPHERANGKDVLRLIYAIGLLATSLALSNQAQGQGSPEILWRTNANTERVRSVAFNGKGTLLASGGGYLNDTRVRVWSVADGGLVNTLTNAVQAVESVAFSPDGSLLASTGGPSGVRPDLSYYTVVNVWQTADWSYRPITNDYPPASLLVFSSDGELMGSTGFGGFGGYITISRTSGGTLVARYGGNYLGYGGLAFSPDGRELASSVFGATTTQIRNATNGAVRIELGPSGSVAFSPDGATLMIAEDRIEPPSHDWGGHTVWLAKTATGAIITNLLHPKSVYTASFTPDGKAIVSWAGDDKIRLWSLRDSSVFQVYDQETTAVWALAVAPNGRYFAYGRDDGVVVLARMPLWITDIVRTNNQVRLTWSGGTGLYQLLRTTDLASGIWENVGDPTTDTSATVAATNHFEFFRVQSLPEP